MSAEDTIRRLAELGDQMAEALECLEGDPVVLAYLKERAGLSAPLWVKAEAPTTDLLRVEWDTEIGKLQDAGIYQADLGANADANVPVEVDA